jgi:hypothetical protein
MTAVLRRTKKSHAMQTKKSLLVGFLAIVIFGCNKRDQVVVPTNSHHTSHSTLREAIANSQNWMDSVGIIHNQGMDFLYDTVAVTHDSSQSSVIAYTDVFATSRGASTLPLNASTTISSIMSDASNYGQSTIANSSLSSAAKTYINDLQSNLVSEASGETLTYTGMIDEIETAEGVVIADGTLGSTDKNRLLGALSIMRRSPIPYVNERTPLGGTSSDDFYIPIDVLTSIFVDVDAYCATNNIDLAMDCSFIAYCQFHPEIVPVH